MKTSTYAQLKNSELMRRIAGAAIGIGIVVAPLTYTYASGSVTIQPVSPSSQINQGQTVTFGALGSGFTNPSYSVTDSFSGSSINSSNINSSGAFSWTPSANDVGAHTITITANDSYGNTASASQVLTVGSSNVTLQNISPATGATVGNPVTFSINAQGFSNPLFSISDSALGTSITNNNITSSGNFSWTPSTADVGTHNLTLVVNDSTGKTGTVSVSIPVMSANLSLSSVTPSSMIVAPYSSFTFNAAPAGFTNPTYTVSDSFNGSAPSSVNSSNINSSGYFTWTPDSTQVGTHLLTVYATDTSGHSANTQVNVTVGQTSNTGTSLSVGAVSPPGGTIVVGSPVSLQTTANGFTNPTYTVSDALTGNSLTNANINSVGLLSWTPGSNDVGTHTITISATDSLGHSASTQTSIVVGSNIAPTLSDLLAKLAQLQAQLAAAMAAQFTFSTNLTVGDTSSDVTQLQQRLTTLNMYSGPITGYFGPLTESAVMNYQTAHGISAVGSVGPLTRASLNSGV
ncbi:MAG: sleB [Candidatus Kaiserbacteria bacterium]|nr:sleB [Candidatus Kaiserbacteria bacterium]